MNLLINFFDVMASELNKIVTINLLLFLYPLQIQVF